jgi:hypothetical protein
MNNFDDKACNILTFQNVSNRDTIQSDSKLFRSLFQFNRILIQKGNIHGRRFDISRGHHQNFTQTRDTKCNLETVSNKIRVCQ